MRIVAFVAMLMSACAARAPQGPPPITAAQVADASTAAVLVIEMGQGLELALYEGGDVPAERHCTIQRVVARSARDAGLALQVIGGIATPARRAEAITALVTGVRLVVDQIAPTIDPSQAAVLRAALSAGMVGALFAADAARLPAVIPPEVVPRFVPVQDSLRRIEISAGAELGRVRASGVPCPN